MLNVIIEPEGLPFSIKLKEILEDRQALVVFTKDKDRELDEKEGTKITETFFVCSKKYFDSINGQAGLIEVAKSHKANAIVVISQIDKSFWVKEDLGGKLININFPEENEEEGSPNEYGLQMIATLVSKNSQFIAGDKTTKKLVQLAERVAKTDVTDFIKNATKQILNLLLVWKLIIPLMIAQQKNLMKWEKVIII